MKHIDNERILLKDHYKYRHLLDDFSLRENIDFIRKFGGRHQATTDTRCCKCHELFGDHGGIQCRVNQAKE